MPWALIAIALTLALVVLLIYPLRVRVEYEWHAEKRPRINAAIHILRWWTLSAPRTRRNIRPPRSPSPFSPLDYLRSIRRFEKLEWETQVGTGSAASTAMAVGALWSVQGTLLAFIAPRFSVGHRPEVKVVPCWDTACFDTRLDCIFRLRLGEIILAWLRGKLKAWRREVKSVGIGKGTSN